MCLTRFEFVAQIFRDREIVWVSSNYHSFVRKSWFRTIDEKTSVKNYARVGFSLNVRPLLPSFVCTLVRLVYHQWPTYECFLIVTCDVPVVPTFFSCLFFLPFFFNYKLVCPCKGFPIFQEKACHFDFQVLKERAQSYLWTYVPGTSYPLPIYPWDHWQCWQKPYFFFIVQLSVR